MHASTVTELHPSVGGSGSGVRGFVVLGCLWNEGQVINVSNDIDRDQQAHQRCGLSKVPQAAGASGFAPASNA